MLPQDVTEVLIDFVSNRGKEQTPDGAYFGLGVEGGDKRVIINPTHKADSACTMYISNPARILFSKPTPIKLIINPGPQLLQNPRMCSASVFVQSLFLYSATADAAPMG